MYIICTFWHCNLVIFIKIYFRQGLRCISVSSVCKVYVSHSKTFRVVFFMSKVLSPWPTWSGLVCFQNSSYQHFRGYLFSRFCLHTCRRFGGDLVSRIAELNYARTENSMSKWTFLRISVSSERWEVSNRSRNFSNIGII